MNPERDRPITTAGFWLQLADDYGVRGVADGEAWDGDRHPGARIAPRRPMSGRGEWERMATAGAVHREAMQPQYSLITLTVSDPELPLLDVPLIVEDLLMLARQLAETGAPTEVLEEILNHVAALREGSD